MQEFDLIIVGSGSGNSIPSPEFDSWRIALVEKGVFGGTCLNVGCIPSKMFVYSADTVEHVRHAGTYGVDATLNGVDWQSIRDRVFGRIDPIAAGGEDYRVNQCPNISVFRDEGRFVDHKVIQVGDTRITADKIILGAGARPFVPDIPGLADVDFHTSDTIMRLDEVPRRLAIGGGGYIACELGHVFAAMGSEVTIISRSPLLLRAEDADISARFTQAFSDRARLYLGCVPRRVWQDDEGIHLDHEEHGDRMVTTVDALLWATGRMPNGDTLDVEQGGIDHDGGRVLVDDTMATNVEGIYAFGDLVNTFQLKHVANAEAKIAFHNVLNPTEPQHMDYHCVPHAVFSAPQVASVGATEAQLIGERVPYVSAIKDFGSTAYGWALEDTTGFVKVLAHAETRHLLGAHIMGPQASTLLQSLIQGMRFGQTVDEMAHGQMWIHPALSEVVENALLEL